VPQLGAKWVAIGHSQGGTAVLFAAELESKHKDSGYLGAIAVAPLGDLQSVFENNIKTMNHGYLAFFAYGVKAVYPDFNYDDFLSPEAVKLLDVVENGGWYVTRSTFAYKVPVGKLLREDWRTNEHFQKYRKLSMPGQKPIYGPVLLLQGEADKDITTRITDALYQRLLNQGATVTYKKYDGLDHEPLIFGSYRDQVRWVQDRFDGKPVATEKRAP
jgi:pimeloyl-ACP methyl ester carboxylesterase